MDPKDAAFAFAIVLLAATALPAAWLDAKVPVNWNTAGAALPAAPRPSDSDVAPGGRCASELRPPTTPEDRAVVRKGWALVGPFSEYGPTSVVIATSSADGMCRPNGFQGFVFVGGIFAGTLSPHLMDARTDASLSDLSVQLLNARQLVATFERYTKNDPLCCPSAATNVTYEIDDSAARSLLKPVSSATSKNP